MNNQPTTVEKLRGLRWSIAANVANTLFSQFTFFGSVFPLFLSQLGLNKSQMGFLFSLMPFFGVISPVIAPATVRFGYKNTYMVFWGTRKIVTALLLLTPWVVMAFGLQAAVLFISVITAIFAFCRAVAETARVPWVQEFVPPSVQGKYTATSNIFTSLAGFASVLIAGYVLDRAHSLSSFMLLIAAGVFFGFICVLLSGFIPGGAPTVHAAGKKPKRNLRDALRDRNFMRYLLGVSVIIVATTPVGSFLPLFMQEEVGLTAGNVVYLQMGGLLGGLLTSFVWGWAADRYGSKPVMLSGMNLRVLVPLLLLLIPRHSTASLPVALAINFLAGMADMGWGIGSTRLLYVSVVPPEKKADYLSLYAAWIGIVGGVSQLLGGFVLDLGRSLSGTWAGLTVDAYTPLFLSGFVLLASCNFIFHALRGDNQFGMRQFTGIFLRGNPFLAMGSLIRYQQAGEEHDAVHVTEQLGRARSPMTVDELLDALADPRFQVRFEAIISIARMPADERLVQALIEIVHGTEVALSVVAAWALGRMGDRSAIPALHAALDAPYQSIRAHAARALGALGDREIIPELMQRLEVATDKGLQMAYASALGKLGATEATDQLLGLFTTITNPGARLELALCLARLVGDEHHFIQLVRRLREDPGTAAAQTLTAFQRKVSRKSSSSNAVDLVLAQAAETFAHDDYAPALQALRTAIELVLSQHYNETASKILTHCAAHLHEFDPQHIEHLLLALHTLDVGWGKGSDH